MGLGSLFYQSIEVGFEVIAHVFEASEGDRDSVQLKSLIGISETRLTKTLPPRWGAWLDIEDI